MNPLQSLSEYEQFIYYHLRRDYHFIQRSTLVVIRRGADIATVSGEVEMPQHIRLVVREQLSFTRIPGEIKRYGYEIWRGTEQQYWYDSQPHPHEPSLASTHPHHKHIHPDIKHNRIPAPGLSFTRPNLPFLIVEIEKSFLAKKP